MTTKVGINGFGRIGRLVCRVIQERKDIEVVAVNDLCTDLNELAKLFKYDSVHGKFNGTVEVKEDKIWINGKPIIVQCERDPNNIKWGPVTVVESTGFFRTLETASSHLVGGATRVVISAPSTDAPMYVMGVNHTKFDPSEKVISNASCTTNCLAPLVKVLNDAYGIEEGLMSTIHAATSTQSVVDRTSRKGREGRSVLSNISPASTGAAVAVGVVIPELKGKLTGKAFRVPVADVSMVDLTVKLKTETTYEDIINTIKEASEGSMKGILGWNDENLVSSDFIGEKTSSVVDVSAGIGLNSTFFKLVSWYDNEIGYSNRVVDLVQYTNSIQSGINC